VAVMAAVVASREDTEHDDVTMAELATRQVVGLDCCQIKNCCVAEYCFML